MSVNGVIFHKFLSTDHVDVEQLVSGSINIKSYDYELDLPQDIPTNTNVSLVVQGINSNVVLLKWDLAASSSTIITSQNSNTIELSAPSALNSNYHLKFPDFVDTVSYPDRVLAIESDDQNGNLQMKFEEFELISEPNIAMSSTNFNFKLLAEDMPTDNVNYVFPNYANGVNYAGKAFSVTGISTVAANHVAVEFGFVDLINSPSFTSTDANKTVQLVDPSSVSVANMKLRFPRIDTGSNFVGSILVASNDDTVGGVELGFTNSNLLMDKIVFSPTTISKSTSANQNTLVFPSALVSLVNHPGKMLVATATTTDTISLSFENVGRLVSDNSNVVTVLPSTTTVEHDLFMPERLSTSVEGYSVSVIADSSTSNRQLQLGFSRHIKVGSDFDSNLNFVTLKTNGNANSYTLFLPGNKLSTSFGQISGFVLGVTSFSSTEVELEFENPWLISNSNSYSTTIYASPNESLTENYTIDMPAIDKNQLTNHYEKRVLQVTSSALSKVKLEYLTLDSFSGISEVDLKNASGFGTSIIASTDLGSYSMELPTAGSASVGDVISIASISTVSGVSITTEFAAPGILRASTSGKLLELRAPDGISSSYELEMPETEGTVEGHTLFVREDGALEFGYPKGLILLDSGYSLEILSGTTDIDLNIQLPAYTQALNQFEGCALFVESQAHALESTVNLSYRKPLVLFNQIDDSFQKNLSSTSTTISSKSTVNTLFTLFEEAASGFIRVKSQVDFESAGDLAHVSLESKLSTQTILESTNGNTLEIDGADNFRADHELSLPVFKSESQLRIGNTLETRRIEGDVLAVKAASKVPLILGSFSPGTPDRFFLASAEIDNVSLSLNDTVLVAGEQNKRRNGIYIVSVLTQSSSVLTRHPNFDTTEKMRSVNVIQSERGSNNFGKYFQLVHDFVRVASGTVDSDSSTNVINGTNTFFTSELQVGDVIRLSDGSQIVVGSIQSDTELLSAFTVASTLSASPFQVGNRVGVDGIEFQGVEGDASSAHIRLSMPPHTRTPELLIGDSGHATRFASSVQDRGLILGLSQVVASTHKQFLSPDSIENTFESSRDVQRVSFSGSRGRKFFRARGSTDLVALLEEGLDFKSSVVTQPNKNLAIVFDDTVSSSNACLSLVSKTYGSGVGSANYGIQCERTGLYSIIIHLRLAANTVAQSFTYANNEVEVRLRSDSGVADSAREHTCVTRFPDVEIFRRNVELTKEIRFRSELQKGSTYYIEFRHSQANSTLVNGVLEVGSCTLLARLVV